MSYDYDTSHDSRNFTKAADSKAVFGKPRDVKGITIHWWGDPNTNPSFAGVRDYLCRANGNTSAHFVASGTNRQVACIVAPGDVAWHSGNATGNATTIGIECDPRCRDEDYDVVAELVADLRSVYGDVPIYSHNMWSSTSCPGNCDIDRIDKLSYTKYSPPGDFGHVTDKNPKQPTPAPVVPPVIQQPIPVSQLPVSDTSPTAGQPDSGKPVTEKDDFEDIKTQNNAILALLQKIWDLLTKIFK